ncbi:Anaphase-promoting complex subunit 2 [Chamberlinius hualienensis]
MADPGENHEMLNEAWKEVSGILDLSLYDSSDSCNLHVGNSFWDSVNVVQAKSPPQLLEMWFIDRAKQLLQDQIAPNFWNYFSEGDEQGLPLFDQFNSAVTYLSDAMNRLLPFVQIMQNISQRNKLNEKTNDKSFMDKFNLTYKGVLFSLIPSDLENAVVEFYSRSLTAYLKRLGETREEDESVGLLCLGCNKYADLCDCHNILLKFYSVNKKLSELQLLERIIGEGLTNVIHRHIEHHIDVTCRGNFESIYLSSLERWLDTVLVGWLRVIFKDVEDNDSSCVVENNKSRLAYYLYETYAQCRMDEMFTIIIEFPDSQPALEDLRNCLEKTNLRTKLIQSLKATLEARLLHPGVNTTDILSAYTSLVRALWVLDPSGVLLEVICQPVHKYLRTRQDTVRCIVASLTDDSSVELADEFSKGEPLVMDDSYHSDDDENWEKWNPDPVDANPDKILKSKRSSDIISMLVNIYGSKDLFVKEYRFLLADRVVTYFNYDVQRELRHLELLKLRFGEGNLHFCEVMLKDVVDSKRINLLIKSQENNSESNVEWPISSLILSAQFWPPLREERLELHPKVKSAFEQYTKAFETLKGNRTLVWKSHLGFVDLEVELKGRTLNLQVSPIHATILLYFQEKGQWNLDELAAVLQCSATVLKRKLSFWQSHYVIREEGTNNYVLVDNQKVLEQDLIMVDDIDEAESAMASTQDQREEELQVYWSYIVGMLTNLEALPLERIHNTLKMFTVQSPTAMECSMFELKMFLERKVKENKLIYSTGTYRLPKANK